MFECEKDQVYARLVHLVLNSEGGYVDDKDDPGGATKYGITMRDNRAILLTLGVKDVRQLTYAQAKQIYYTKYYLASGANLLASKSIRLAYLHFDAAVNHGAGTAAKFLRRVTTFEKFPYVEGGEKNTAFWVDAFEQYIAIRNKYYRDIIADHPKLAKFRNGWANRIKHLLESSKNMPN